MDYEKNTNESFEHPRPMTSQEWTIPGWFWHIVIPFTPGRKAGFMWIKSLQIATSECKLVSREKLVCFKKGRVNRPIGRQFFPFRKQLFETSCKQKALDDEIASDSSLLDGDECINWLFHDLDSDQNSFFALSLFLCLATISSTSFEQKW